MDNPETKFREVMQPLQVMKVRVDSFKRKLGTKWTMGIMSHVCQNCKVIHTPTDYVQIHTCIICDGLISLDCLSNTQKEEYEDNLRVLKFIKGIE